MSGAVLALTTLSFRDVIVVSPLVQEGRRRSYIEEEIPSTSSPSYRHSSSSSSSRERARKWHKSKRRNTLVYVLLNVTNVRRNTRGRGILLHLLLRLLQFSSDSFSSQQRSSARKKSRNCSRSLSSADENPHDPAPTTECPALLRDHISRYADDDDEFNWHFEDLQDLAPEDETHNVFEIHSNVSSEDMRFQNFIEEVFSFFFWPTSSQRKQMRFWEGTG